VSNPQSSSAGGVLVGIDLAWSTGVTGLAALDGTGRLIRLDRATTDDQINAWLASLPGTPSVVAVDAPLVVPNRTGQRPAETMIGRAYGPYGASAYPSNRTLLGDQPRALRLAQRFGWTIDPQVRPQPGTPVCIEVYPHPALIGLFGLPYRIAYKKGSTAQRLPGFQHLAGLLESVPELHVEEHPRWQQIRAVIDSPAAGDLTRIEDEIDAVVCAHVAWLWQHNPDALEVYGDLVDGYIVAPPPPTHRPVQPAPIATNTPSGGGPVAPPRPRRVHPSSHEARTLRPATSRLQDDVLEVRAMLIDRINQGDVPVTYADVARHVDRIANGLGPLLDELETLCQKRGEPNLAVLVVNQTTREPTKYAHRDGDWRAEQRACLAHAWSQLPAPRSWAPAASPPPALSSGSPAAKGIPIDSPLT
jgi:predicted RNase H-like nuclease